jgi:predicted PurR-regulated permease PerM
MPTRATELLERFRLTDFTAAQERLSAGLAKASQALATRALNVGQSTFDFTVGLGMMLYLLFFLLREGDVLSRRIVQAGSASCR